MGDIKKQSPGSIGNVGGKFPRQTEPDEILGEQEMRDALEELGLVIANPEDFGRAKAGERGIGNILDELLRPHLFGDPIALRLAALIAPNEGGAKHRESLVKQHDAVHLSGKTHGGDV